MTTQHLTLPDGRTVCFWQSGNPGGLPLFYFHGYPGSRLEAGLLPGLAVRVIAIDRPGYGGSAAQSGRRLLDWPADVAAVADHLRIDRFAVLGVSGGGPYAAACAYGLCQRVVAACLLCPVPPASALAGIPRRRHADLALLMLLGRHPRAARLALAAARAGMRDPRLLTPARIRRWGPHRLAPRDMEALSTPVITEVLASFREGIRPGIEGVWSDAGIYARPWGFSLADVRVPLQVWHGTADTVVPAFSSAAYEAAPLAQRHLVAGEGHYSLILGHGARIIGRMAAGLATR
jgi:pimeloyl-ACP methyl ester carboxylesterase